MNPPQSDVNYPEIHPPVSVDHQRLKFLAVGKSGIVYAIDEERVLKEYHSEGIDVERRVLARLGSHPNIVKFLGGVGNSIIFERGRPLRSVIQTSGADDIPLDKKTRWLWEAAEGMRHMHNSGLIHADTGCHNMILVKDSLKIIDFEGCSIDGEEATSCYEWFSYHESTPAISWKTDILAYGCLVYELMTGRHPYEELAKFDDRMRRVKRLYAENQFPEVEYLPLRHLIQGCWRGIFKSMDEVLEALGASILTLGSQVEARYGAVGRPTSMKKLAEIINRGSVLRAGHSED